jgi:hypothetical protein
MDQFTSNWIPLRGQLRSSRSTSGRHGARTRKAFTPAPFPGESLTIRLPSKGNMSKNQTRRSISVRGETYKRLKAFCQAEGKSMSGVIEDLVTDFLSSAITKWEGSAPTPPVEINSAPIQSYNDKTRPPPTKPESKRSGGNVRQF